MNTKNAFVSLAFPAALALVLSAAVGCNGIIWEPPSMHGEGPAARPGDNGRPPAEAFDPTAPPPSCDGVCLGETRLTRLTRDSYVRSVESAFGADVTFDHGVLPPDGIVGGHFASNEGAHYIEATATAYLAAAEQIAEALAPTIGLSCDPGADAAACGREVFMTYAPALFRREVDDAWAEPYADLYAATHADEGEDVALQLTLSTLLQSPYFLYRIEAVTDGAIARLDGHALATRLSLLLWRDAPDAELRRAAAAGELDDQNSLRAQAERLLADPRADAGLARFHEEWLGLDRLELTGELAAGLRSETQNFVVDAIRGGGDAQLLFSSPTATLDDAAAVHYGTTGGDAVEVPGRVGLLTHGSVLASHGGPGISRPIQRGAFLLTDAICNELGSPPSNVNLAEVLDMAEALGPEASVREKVESVTGGGACASCHALINPPGFAFEAFDVDGRFLPEATDTAGEVRTEAGTVEFTDHADLIQGLLDNRSLQACYTVQWFRYSLGRENTVDDARPLYDIYQAFEGAGHSLSELVVQIVLSDPFTHRRAPVPSGASSCD